MNKRLGRLLRKLRKEKGFSQRELARRARLNPGYYCRAENGQVPLSEEALMRVVNVLRVSPTRLLATAGLIRSRFPYDAIAPGVKKACLKLAEGKPLNPEDKDWLLHLALAWGLFRAGKEGHPTKKGEADD